MIILKVDTVEIAICKSYDVEVDNVEVDNVEIDNVEVDNLEVENVEVDNVDVDNFESWQCLILQYWS